MIPQPIWLEPQVIIAIHEQQIAEHGGLCGLRDRALLESAMARAQNLYAYGEPTIFEMAAAYAFAFVAPAPHHPKQNAALPQGVREFCRLLLVDAVDDPWG